MKTLIQFLIKNRRALLAVAQVGYEVVPVAYKWIKGKVQSARSKEKNG